MLDLAAAAAAVPARERTAAVFIVVADKQGQINTLESANINAETMAAMRQGADALKVIHSGLCVATNTTTMRSLTHQAL